MKHVDHVYGLIKFVREAVVEKDDDQNPGLEDCVQAAAQQHAALLAAAKALIEGHDQDPPMLTAVEWDALRKAVGFESTAPAATEQKPEQAEFGDGSKRFEVKLKRSTSHNEVAWLTIQADDEEEAEEIALEHEHEIEWENDDAMDDLYNGDAEVAEVEEA